MLGHEPGGHIEGGEPGASFGDGRAHRGPESSAQALACSRGGFISFGANICTRRDVCSRKSPLLQSKNARSVVYGIDPQTPRSHTLCGHQRGAEGQVAADNAHVSAKDKEVD